MPYQIQPSDSFVRSITGAKREYYRKNKRGHAEFLDAIQEFLQLVEQHGERFANAESTHWPPGMISTGWAFSKYSFRTPQLSGEAGQGRILFAVYRELNLAYPLFFYTHREYKGQPADKDIRRLLEQALADVAAFEERAKSQ